MINCFHWCITLSVPKIDTLDFRIIAGTQATWVSWSIWWTMPSSWKFHHRTCVFVVGSAAFESRYCHTGLTCWAMKWVGGSVGGRLQSRLWLDLDNHVIKSHVHPFNTKKITPHMIQETRSLPWSIIHDVQIDCVAKSKIYFSIYR